jgi:hypothetical protein
MRGIVSGSEKNFAGKNSETMGLFEDLFGDHEEPWYTSWVSDDERKQATDDWLQGLMSPNEDDEEA